MGLTGWENVAYILEVMQPGLKEIFVALLQYGKFIHVNVKSF